MEQLTVNQAIEKMNAKNVQSWRMHSTYKDGDDIEDISFTGSPIDALMTIKDLVEALSAFPYTSTMFLILELDNEHEEHYYLIPLTHA